MAQLESKSKGLFVLGTGTDIGKTFITGLLVKTLRDGQYKAGYYKAAVSGAPSIAASDAGYVKKWPALMYRTKIYYLIYMIMPYRLIWQLNGKVILLKKP